MDNDSLLKRRMADICELADKYSTARFSDFLDEREQAVVQECIFGATWFGGYQDAGRKIAGFFPEWQEPDFGEFPISCVRIKKKGPRELSHRDYLGTLMSLGLDRKKIGDISVLEDGAYVFTVSDMAEHISGSINKIANCSVECCVIGLSDVKVPQQEFVYRDIVAAGMRLDAVVASCTGLSRKNASDLISSGKCSVNHKEAAKVDYLLKEGDLLSLRGFGRFVIERTGTNTRSGRLHITVKKFI